MSKQDIVDRIIADAEEEAKGIIAEAQASADKLIADKNAECKALMEQTEGETAVKVKAIQDGKAATARLDGAKILLSAKRGVIDGIYEEAFSQLLRMSENDWLKLTATLLEKYAEQGDSIAFADGYPCAKGVYELPIVKDKKLKITFGKADIKGGFILIGKNSDKNLSLEALLAADRESNEGAIAAEIFK
jgi:vacuolar-type H+-ATPase subunit E/Vma4